MGGRWLWDFLNGYLILRLYGQRVADLINWATRENIGLWQIRYLKDGAVQMKIRKQDFWQLWPHIRQTQTKMRLERKVGFPFIVRNVWRRKAFLFGAFCFVMSLYVLTSLVWSVDIEGTNRLSPQTVREVARQVGIYPGQWRGRLADTDLLQHQMLDKIPELSWVGVRIQGTHVQIQVVEKVPGWKSVAEGPQHIVARKAGTIREIFVYQGKAVVSRGQFVRPGEVLISGALGDGSTHVTAKGKVEADVWYTSNVVVPRVAKRLVLTGQEVKREYIKIGSFSIKVWGYGKPPFSYYHERDEEQPITLGSIPLPFSLRHVTLQEEKVEELVYTPEEARKKALALAQADVATKMSKDGRVYAQKILQEKFEHDKLYVRVWTDVIEDIGKAQGYQPLPSHDTDKLTQ